jgi:hypothetical protein
MKENGVRFLDEPKKDSMRNLTQFEDLDGNVFVLKG